MNEEIKLIENLLISIFPQIEKCKFNWRLTPKNQPGDIGFPCFEMSKKLNMSAEDTAKLFALIINIFKRG